MLISTKHDLAESQTHFEQITAFKNQRNIADYFSTSAKNGLGITDTFTRLTELVVKSFDETKN